MNKFCIFLFLFLINFVSFSQENKYYNEAELNENGMSQTKQTENSYSFHRFRTGVYGGYSYRTASIPSDSPNEIKNYYQSLKNGFHIGLNETFFIKNFFGIGLEYELNRFTTSKSIAIANTNGNLVNCTEKFTFNQLLIMCNFRFQAKKLNNSYLFLAAGLGYINYYDRLYAMLNIHVISEIGHTVCDNIRIGYEFGVSDRIGIFLQSTISSGILLFTTVVNEATKERALVNCINEYGNLIGLGRIELSAGIRF